MDFITGKHIPRRTFVRAMGATVTLPELYAAAGGRFAFDAETLGDHRLGAEERRGQHHLVGDHPGGRLTLPVQPESL